MNSQHRYWTAFDKGYRHALRGRRFATNFAPPSVLDQLNRELDAARIAYDHLLRSQFDMITPDERRLMMFERIGEITSLKRQIARNDTPHWRFL